LRHLSWTKRLTGTVALAAAAAGLLAVTPLTVAPAFAQEAAPVAETVEAAPADANAVVEAPAETVAAPAEERDGNAERLQHPPNKGDVAFMLVSTILVLLMTIPGLALFYGGLVRSKNMLSVLMQVFAIVTVMV
jgi:ammonium transporter, Amt family